MTKEKEIEKLGEFGLIRQITRRIELKNNTSILGVGDDAAIIGLGDKKMVVTTDMLTEGIHFDLVYTPLKHLGYKAITVNLSDIFAMNAFPKQVLVSMAISSKFTTEMIEELYEGIHKACAVYAVDLVGGDTTSSLTGLTICVTALGEARESKLVCRSGAQVNDLICVTGNLGAAYMGLQLLEREKKLFGKEGQGQPDLEGYDYVLERLLKPEARGDIVKVLAEKGIVPNSMIDISDGLSSEILHICDASGVGCKIYADKIPIVDETRELAMEFNLEHVTTSMNGGEDYELLFTVPVKEYDKIISIPDVTVIGHIMKKQDGKYLVLADDSYVEVSAMGWNSLLGTQEKSK